MSINHVTLNQRTGDGHQIQTRFLEYVEMCPLQNKARREKAKRSMEVEADHSSSTIVLELTIWQISLFVLVNIANRENWEFVAAMHAFCKCLFPPVLIFWCPHCK